MLRPPLPHVSAGPYYLLRPEALQTRRRACGLVPATAVPRSWALGLEGRGAPTVGSVTLRGRGTGPGDRTRLRSTEEQRRKPLCFGSPGERWQCLAPAISPGVLWFKRSRCSLEKPYRGVTWGCYRCFREVCVEARRGCPLQHTEREHCGSGTEQGFPNACQPIEIAMPSGRSVFSSPPSLSKRVGGLSWEEIHSLFLSLVLKTSACSPKGQDGGLVLTGQWKSCTVHSQRGDR